MIHRGEFVTSREILAMETGLSEQQVRTAIQKLINSENITSTSTSKFTLIKIHNYELYQEYKPTEQPAEQPADNQPSTSNQPTSNQQVTTTKEPIKNEEEVKNVFKKEKINKKEKVENDILPEPPSFVDSNLWDLFVEHRATMRKPLSIHACNLYFNDFTKWNDKGIDVNECIKSSITNGWQGIFERNEYQKAQAPSTEQNPAWQTLTDWEKSRSEA